MQVLHQKSDMPGAYKLVDCYQTVDSGSLQLSRRFCVHRLCHILLSSPSRSRLSSYFSSFNFQQVANFSGDCVTFLSISNTSRDNVQRQRGHIVPWDITNINFSRFHTMPYQSEFTIFQSDRESRMGLGSVVS